MTAEKSHLPETMAAVVALFLVGAFFASMASDQAQPNVGAKSPVDANAAPIPKIPKIAAASGEAEAMTQALKLESGFAARLFAAEPMVANPVAFWFVDGSRAIVCETFRQEKDGGVADNRDHDYWVPDELKAQTIDDRKKMVLKHHPDYAKKYTENEDRLRWVIDDNGDGRADRAPVFAGGFNDLLDGTGAGVLVRGKDVFYTCIPNLWRLRDRDGDDVADERTVLHGGFGVRYALRGHDMHGLVIGPDGRLYWSIGDRGYNVKTPEGSHLFDPGRGAVFRMNMDGSELEVYATGLRNPQELTFDDDGNLFTGDNNGDGGDQARFVYVAEGGETGWRMNFQTIPERGPWVKEKWWEPRHDGQPAFLLPPLSSMGSGPSGITYYPGTGFPERYNGHFFLCDFLGDRGPSGIRTFGAEKDGAGFKVVDSHWLVRNILPTDVDFVADGSLAVADWVEGWVGEGKGNIVKIIHPQTFATKIVAETADLLQSPRWGTMTDAELSNLLGHPDRRVRQESQFALAARGEGARGVFAATAFDADAPSIARRHALWGLEMISRRDGEKAAAVVKLLGDRDVGVRAQAAKILGEVRCGSAKNGLIAALADDDRRVQYFAALSLMKIGDAAAVDPIFAMLERNADKDHFLRHAGVFALTKLCENRRDAVYARVDSKSSAVRLAVVLIARRWKDAVVAKFLDDPSSYVAQEAALAAYDVPIPAAVGAVADRLAKAQPTRPFTRRAIAAAEFRGSNADADALAAYAAAEENTAGMRQEALEALGRWATAKEAEPVLNDWRPRGAHRAEPAVAALRDRWSKLLASRDGKIAEAAARVAGKLAAKDAEAGLAALFKNPAAKSESRMAALDALAATKSNIVKDLARDAFKETDGRVRAKAASVLATIDPVEALPLLESILERGGIAEKQSALDALGRINSPAAEEHLTNWMKQLAEGDVAPGVELDLLAAARRRADGGSKALAAALDAYEAAREKADLWVRYKECLDGGDAERGRKLFKESEASCLRCHSMGGDDRKDLAGPVLADIGKRKDRKYILESILDPNKEVAPGYLRELVSTDRGTYEAKIIAETADTLEFETTRSGDVEKMSIPKSAIKGRKPGVSAMPQDISKSLKRQDIRDLIEYLATHVDPESKPKGH